MPEPETDTDVAMRRCHGGSIELTAAGVAVTNRLLVDAGYDAPTAGRFSDATATELFVCTDLDDFQVLCGEARRGAAGAIPPTPHASWPTPCAS